MIQARGGIIVHKSWHRLDEMLGKLSLANKIQNQHPKESPV